MTSFQNIHINFVSRSNSQSHQQHLKSSNIDEANQIQSTNRIPKCFYHPDKEISFFCKHRTHQLIKARCTLPLCEKCLPIHRLQHLNCQEIPMENVVTFAECKKFILSAINESKTRVKSNQKQFQKQILIYKEKLIEIIESTVKKLKEEILVLEKKNSILKLEQLKETMDKIQKQNSLSEIIKGYEMYYEQNQINQQPQNGPNQQDIRQHSIIDHIKFVADQKNLIHVVERGFLNCKFVKLQPQTHPPKISRESYLKNDNEFSKYERTPIHKLQTFITNEKNNKTLLNTNLQQKPSDESEQTHINSFKIIEINKKLRKNIFNQKENNSLEEKSLSFSNNSKQQIKNARNLQKEPLFSDVKKFNLNDSTEGIVLGKRKNIYTQNLKFESRNSSESSFVSRQDSNSSLRERNSKGLSLTRQKHGIDKHYLMKQRDSIKKMKERLLRAENEESSQIRENSWDWKRVVNLSESKVSGSVRDSSGQRPKMYHIKKEQNKRLELVTGESLSSDVLNPMEMRKLLMKKKNNKEEMNTIDLIQKEYQQQLQNSRLHY